jgi:hypothetical protein
MEATCAEQLQRINQAPGEEFAPFTGGRQADVALYLGPPHLLLGEAHGLEKRCERLGGGVFGIEIALPLQADVTVDSMASVITNNRRLQGEFDVRSALQRCDPA